MSYGRKGSGLFNSTRYIVEALCRKGIDAEIIEVVDNNDIDREVTRFHPDIVVIEALWVVPSKFDILKALHPGVTWFVHLHSNMPFLAQEGVAIQWIRGSAERGVGIIANSEEAYKSIAPLMLDYDLDLLYYLPNIYHRKMEPVVERDENYDSIDIGCFGAVRPLKNQLIQAMAAIKFARQKGKHLRFHVNGSRSETGGDSVLKNLVNLFDSEDGAELVFSPWWEGDTFIPHLYENIDLGMQVSLTETFNVVTADYVTAGLPVVVSREIKWVSRWCQADTDDIDSIVAVMHRVWSWRMLTWWNQKLLRWSSQHAEHQWLLFARLIDRFPAGRYFSP